MAEVQLPLGIVAIHGRLGDYVYRTRKQADGSNKVFVHYLPKKKKKKKPKKRLSIVNGHRMTIE